LELSFKHGKFLKDDCSLCKFEVEGKWFDTSGNELGSFDKERMHLISLGKKTSSPFTKRKQITRAASKTFQTLLYKPMKKLEVYLEGQILECIEGDLN